jgi:tetratricopeptide (TPR) repeat protein
VVAGLAAGLALVTALGFAGVTWQWRQAEKNLDEANRQRACSTERFRLAHRAVSQMIVSPRIQGLQKEAAEVETLERALGYYREFIREQPEDGAVLRPELATAYQYVGYLSLLDPRGPRREEARAALKEALSLWEQLLAEAPEVTEYQEGLAETSSHLGWACMLAGDHADAVPYLEEACRRFLDLARRDNARAETFHRLSFAYSRLGIIHRLRGDLGKARRVLEDAYRLCERMRGERLDDPYLQRLLANVCLIYAKVLEEGGRLNEARAVLVKALALSERLLAAHPNQRDYLRWVANYASAAGDLYAKTGEPREAREVYRRGLLAAEQRLAANPDPSCRRHVAVLAYGLGKMSAETGEPRRALRAYQRAAELYGELARARPAGRDDRAGLGASHHQVGRLHAELGHPGRAVEALRRAVEARERLCRDYPDDARLRGDLAGTRRRLKSAQDRLAGGNPSGQ